MIPPPRRFWELALVGVLLAAAVLLLARTASVPLLDPDEARFARTSVEMLRSGDRVVPRFEGEPRLVKPPLIHWIQAPLLGWLGSRAWVARLHSAVAVLVLLVLAWRTARGSFGEEGAFWTAAVLATTPLLIGVGRVGGLDALLAVHVFAVVAADLLRDEVGRPPPALVVGVLLGLAFLVKGPVGVILPLLLLLAGRTAVGRPILPSLGRAAQVVAGFAAAVLPWGLVLLQRVGAAPLLAVVRREALERYFAGHDHVEPPGFFLAVLAVGLLPWFGPLLAAVVRLAFEWRRPASATARYAGAGLLIGLVFFSLGKSKLASYVVPLVPLAALLVAWELGRQLAEPERRAPGAWLLFGNLAIAAGALGLAGALRPELAPPGVAAAGAGVLAAAAAVAWAGLQRRRPRWVFGAAVAGGAGLLAILVLGLLPRLGETRSAAPLVQEVPELRSAAGVAVVDMRVPSLTFYLDRVPERVDLARLAARADRDDGGTLFVFDWRDLEQLDPEVRARLVEIGRQGKYRVLRRRVVPGGQPGSEGVDVPP